MKVVFQNPLNRPSEVFFSVLAAHNTIFSAALVALEDFVTVWPQYGSDPPIDEAEFQGSVGIIQNPQSMKVFVENYIKVLHDERTMERRNKTQR